MKKSDGFTLTELLAVIVILGILVGIAVPVYFNVTKSIKQSEYNSKKQYMENKAAEYAKEHNTTASLNFTVSVLVANGYITADRYVVQGSEEVPWIDNPIDSNDNMACHKLNITVDNYEYSASMSDDSDCSYMSEDTVEAKLGISAYKLTNNTIGDKISWIENNKTLDTVDTDILLVINPTYSGVTDIKVPINGVVKTFDSSKMLKNPSKGSTIDANNYCNVVVIRAQSILKEKVIINVQTSQGLKSTTIEVRINKEVEES